MKKFVAVIDPAMHSAEADCFNTLALGSPLTLTYHLPKLAGMASLLNAPEPAGIIVLGSASSVQDGYAWQQELSDWLKPRMDAGTPTLGLCFGHQLIAHLYGAPVEFMFPDQTKLSGFRTVRLKPNRLWGENPVEGPLLVSHKEAVTECPKGFEVIGTSEAVAIDAIAHRTLPIWGFQPHPESTLAFLQSHGISAEDAEKKLGFGRSIMGRFLEFVSSGRR